MAQKSKRFEPLSIDSLRFKGEYLDFQRGIRVGNLADDERVTRILKLALESRYQESFVTERWGRGVFWRWIGFLSRANRAAKPLSANVSFGCAKFFVMLDPDENLFKCGMQVERGYINAPRDRRQCLLQPDWDWNRLIEGLEPNSPMERELKRLTLREGFEIFAGTLERESPPFSHENFPGVERLRLVLESAPKDRWAGFLVYYPMNEKEVAGSNGADLIESMLAVFEESTPLMNLCMQTRLRPRGKTES